MPPTKLQVLLNGVPLAGATLVFGEVGVTTKVTDANGIAAYPNITPPWVGYTEVLVSGPVSASAKVVVTAGETTVIDLGEREET